MTTDDVLDMCFWYLEHVHLLLIPAMIFDAICWVFIIVWWRKRGREWWRSRTNRIEA